MNHAAIVEAALARQFPDPVDRAEARRLLDGYGTESGQRETARVRAAMLKCAGPSLAKLARMLELARQDYRDVLAAAEYPRQMASGITARSNPEASAREVREDAGEYRRWIRSLGPED